MKAEWVIACRYAEPQDNGPTMVGAGHDTTVIPGTPIRALIDVVLSLTATWYEMKTGQQHELTFAVTGPDGRERSPETWLLTPSMPDRWGFPEGSSGRLLEVRQLDVRVDAPGVHVARFSIDGSIALLEHNFVVGTPTTR